MCFLYLFYSAVKNLYIHNLLLRFILNSNTTSNINIFKFRKFFTHFKYIPNCFNKYVLVFALEVRPNMLMKSNNMNIILFRYLQKLFDLIKIYSKFTLRSTCDNLISFSSSKFGVYPHENLFVF
jgi:hypothetical protein